MKKIDRTLVPAPPYLLAKGPGEHAHNIAAANASPQGKFKKDVYTKDPIKKAIDLLNNKKCGYCGIPTNVEATRDVEHYRPANAVEYSSTVGFETGYYWLSAEWTNLLPSCHLCNRERTDREIYKYLNGSFVTEKVGKGSQFPLDTVPTQAPKDTIGIAHEAPLLFNPCNIDPKTLFDFVPVLTIRGRMKFLRPKVSLTPLEKRIAEASIEILGLNRIDLCEDRETVFVVVEIHIVNIGRIFSNGSNKNLLADELAGLIDTIDKKVATSRFNGMIWYFFEADLKTIARRLDTLENYGLPAETDGEVIIIMDKFKQEYFEEDPQEAVALVPRRLLEP